MNINNLLREKEAELEAELTQWAKDNGVALEKDQLVEVKLRFVEEILAGKTMSSGIGLSEQEWARLIDELPRSLREKFQAMKAASGLPFTPGELVKLRSVIKALELPFTLAMTGRNSRKYSMFKQKKYIRREISPE